MVAEINNEQVSWLSPAPLWQRIGDLSDPVIQQRFVRPAILRFADDEFMQELMRVLAFHPDRLNEWEARFETWEKPMARPRVLQDVSLPIPAAQVSRLTTRLARQAIKRMGTLPVATSNALITNEEVSPPRRLKLYQPIQQRYYLVNASLVCRRSGLPDRRPDNGKQERVSFVVRRIILAEGGDQPDEDPQSWDEYAYVMDELGARWQQVKHMGRGSAERLLPGEELLGMFPLGYEENDGRKRGIWGGVIPAGRREAYLSTRISASTAGGESEEDEADKTDPRILLLQLQVTGPWAQLVQQARDEKQRVAIRGENTSALHNLFLSSPPSDVPDDTKKESREQMQTVSWYLLLDLERFLFNHALPFWNALKTNDMSILDPDREKPLADWFEGFRLDNALRAELGEDAKESLWNVLVELAQNQEIGVNLENVEVPYDQDNTNEGWPEFLFPLAEPRDRGPFPFTVLDLGSPADYVNLAGHDIDFDNPENYFAKTLARLEELVEAVLPSKSTASMPEINLPNPENTDPGSALFTIRCVYERPNCGPLVPPVVSAPTESFEMASFFDPDAPARPARIPMPGDITPAGLRKFSKSTTMAVSDLLCGQIRRIRKLTLGDLVLSVLPWPFHKNLPNVDNPGPCGPGGNPFGLFCSLSIPIVTLCALILLIIMVLLFDLFFRWLPYLFLCLPIPGLRGKR